MISKLQICLVLVNTTVFCVFDLMFHKMHAYKMYWKINLKMSSPIRLLLVVDLDYCKYQKGASIGALSVGRSKG